MLSDRTIYKLKTIGGLMILTWLIVHLMGCQTKPLPTVQVTAPQVPTELRRCKDAPETPKGASTTQRQVATYVANLGGAYRDCKDKLHRVDGLLTDFEVAATKK